MTVKVYIWLTTKESVGHAAMELGDGTYISLWPGEDKAGSKKKSKNGKKQDIHVSESLEDDIEGEERKYDTQYQIHNLDEKRIKHWWRDFCKTSWSWRQNCCKTVIDGLREGGSDDQLSWIVRMNFKTEVIWAPHKVCEYCSYVTTGKSVLWAHATR